MRGRLSGLGFVVSVCLLLESGGTASAAVTGRDGIRDFPEGSLCPVHVGAIPGNDQYVFTAEGRKAEVTFVACDTRVHNDSSLSLDITVDSVKVVRLDVYNAVDANGALVNHLPYDWVTGFVGGSDVGLDEQCYQATDGEGVPINPVTSVFDTANVSAFSRQMPFLDEFDGPAAEWTLRNAEVRDGALLLAQGQPDFNFFPPLPGRNSCSTAAFRVGGLTRGASYVLDFNWRIDGLNDDDTPVMSVFIDTTPSR